MAGATSLVWNLAANSEKYVAGMSRAAKATDATSKAQKRNEQSSKALRLAVSAISAAAVVKFAKDSVGAYTAAQASQAKLEAAYANFPKLADTNIESLRALNSELQKKTRFDDDDTAAMQARLAMFDLTGKQISDLTPLVQDLASATGQELGTAGEQLGKALLGNTRALKAIGIDYKLTGDRATDFAAIQQLVNEKVGGFAEREGKTAAGQAAILANQYGDLQESVGEALIPALTSATEALTGMLEKVNSLPKGTRDTALAIAALGAAAGVAAPKMLDLNTALKQYGMSLAGIAARAGAIAALAGVVYGLGRAAAYLDDALGKGEKSIDDWSSSLKQGINADDLNRIRTSMEGVGFASNGAAAAFARFGQGDVIGGISAITNAGEEVENFDAAMAGMASSGNLKFVEATIATLGLSAEEAAEKLPQTTAALQSYGEKSSWAAAQTLKVATEAAEATEEVISFAQALDDLNAPARSVTESQIALINAQKELREGLDDSSKSFDIHSEAGQANRRRLIEAASAVDSLAAALEKKGKKEDEVRKVVLRHRDALVDNLTKTGLARDKAEKLVDQYLKVPPAAKAATSEVEKLTEALSKVPTSKSILLSFRTKASNIPERAAGGPVTRGTTYLVGEKGPELFTASASGRITPNNALVGSSSVVAGTGGASLTLSGSAPIELRMDSERVWKGLLQLKKAKGGAKLHLD